MTNLSNLIESSNILEEILSFNDETLFSYFKELSKLNFQLNRHGMQSKHEFSVIEHTKKLLKNFSLALKYRDNPDLFKSDLAGGTFYKKDFFRRVIQLIDKINLKPDSESFKIIVLALLLHDVGKGSYDKTDIEIEEESNEYQKKGISCSVDYLKLFYRTKDHEERGASLAYSLLEEVDGVSQNFANRVKHLILGHGDFNKLQSEKDFNFLVFLRRIMDYATSYNYPILRQSNPGELLIQELDINYLIFLIDIYSVDDKGKVWYSVKQEKETIYLKANWILGRKLNDILLIIKDRCSLSGDQEEKVTNLIKKNYLKSFRTNSHFLLDTELENICSLADKKKILSLLNHFFDHTDKMLPIYLNNTSPLEKQFHIELLQKAKDSLYFHLESSKDTIQITLVKKFAPEGTLLKIVKNLIMSSIHFDRSYKIMNLSAYSGEDGRLIDIVTIRNIAGNYVTEEVLSFFEQTLTQCNDPNYETSKLEMYLDSDELENRINSINVELNEIEIGSRKFQELKIETIKLSNYVFYCCLLALSYINIIDVRVEPFNKNHVSYYFLISQRQSFQITSTAAFKKELIDQLYQNVLISV